MNHDIHCEGYAFRLRPISIDDAEFIIELRTSQPERTKYLHPIDTNVHTQRDYLSQYLERANDYYFIVERISNNSPEGAIGIYDLNPIHKNAEWGRWVLKDRSLGAVESSWLIYKVGFIKLNLQHVYCRTIINNEPVVSFHDTCGLKRNRILSKHFDLNGQNYDAIEHSIDKTDWDLSIEQKLNQKSQLIARRLT
jgi:RimJ/RimL family protein N-acetyltransferase